MDVSKKSRKNKIGFYFLWYLTAKSASSNRGVRPMAAPLEGGIAGLVHPRERVQHSGYHVCFTRSRSPVRTRHPVRLSFFCSERCRRAAGVADELKFTRESRGRREDNRTSSSINIRLLEIFLKVLEVLQLRIVEQGWFRSTTAATAPAFAAAVARDLLLLELIAAPALRSVFHPARPFFLLHVHGDVAGPRSRGDGGGSRRDDRARAERSEDEG